jgi:hypothetical protein
MALSAAGDHRGGDRGDHADAPEMYCHGIARIDKLGPNRRIVFTVPRVDGDGYQDVVVKLILPAELMMKLAYMVAGADHENVSPELIAHQTGRAN